MREIYLYHITPRKNVDSIKKDGLKVGCDGLVYLFNGVDVLNDDWDFSQDPPTCKWYYEPLDSVIAKNEVFIKDYAMIKVRIRKPKDIEVDTNDGIGTRGLGHKFKYCHDILPDDILDVSFRSCFVPGDCSDLELVVEGYAPELIVKAADPKHARFWNASESTFIEK